MSKIKPLIITQNNYEIKISYGSKKKTNIYTNVFIKNKIKNESFLISCLTSYTILNSSTGFIYINYRKEAGLVELVKELETKKEILLQHVKELNTMEQDFINEAPYMMGMLFSYERGFLRGLAALSLEQIKSI